MIGNPNIERYFKSKFLFILKVLIIYHIILFSHLTISGQTEPFQFNYSLPAYMLKDSALLNQITIQQNCIIISSSFEKLNLNNQEKTIIYWDEAPLLLNYITNHSMADVIQLFKSKGNKNYAFNLLSKKLSYNEVKTDSLKLLSGIRIALDPGHFAHNFETAKMERKYVRLRASDFGTENDIQLFEARLTWITASILRDKLEEDGATVLVTRGENTSATGKNFDDWYKSDFKTNLESDFKTGIIDSLEYSEYLKNSESRLKTLRGYFMKHELRVRAEKINQFHPDLSLMIHFNVDEKNVPDHEGYHKPHDMNYAMMFVGGSFTAGELDKLSDRILFFRQFLSNDIQKSILLSAMIHQSITNHMKVPSYKDLPELSYINNYCIPVKNDSSGLFHRNLALTRMVYGTIAFAEPLLQDNRKEAILLNQNDCEWKGQKVPCRLVQMAESYHEGIKNFIINLKYLRNND